MVKKLYTSLQIILICVQLYTHKDPSFSKLKLPNCWDKFTRQSVCIKCATLLFKKGIVHSMLHTICSQEWWYKYANPIQSLHGHCLFNPDGPYLIMTPERNNKGEHVYWKIVWARDTGEHRYFVRCTTKSNEASTFYIRPDFRWVESQEGSYDSYTQGDIQW